jgi:hypothetical protein
MQDGWYVDSKHFFHWIPVPQVAMAVSYVLDRSHVYDICYCWVDFQNNYLGLTFREWTRIGPKTRFPCFIYLWNWKINIFEKEVNRIGLPEEYSIINCMFWWRVERNRSKLGLLFKTKMETKIKLKIKFLVPFTCGTKLRIVLIDYLELKPKQFFFF